MTSITNVHIQNLSHDSKNGHANFGITCTIGTKPANVMGLLPIALSGDPKESEINVALKNQLADFLQALSSQVRSSP